MAMQPGRARTGGYIPQDEGYDNALMDTGSASTLPNGTVFAIFSGVNSTSISTNGSYDGNMVLAVAEDEVVLVGGGLGVVVGGHGVRGCCNGGALPALAERRWSAADRRGLAYDGRKEPGRRGDAGIRRRCARSRGAPLQAFFSAVSAVVRA